MEPDDIFSVLYPVEVMETKFPAETPIGMAYVPLQKIGMVYDSMKAFDRGTLYPELDKPFLGGGMMQNE